MTQKARPVEDVLNFGWSPSPVYARVDEEVPDDSDLVSASPGGAEFVVKLARLAPPVVGAGEPAHRLTVRMAGPESVMVELLQGDTVIAGDTFTPGLDFDDYTLAVTRAEAARILYQPGPDGDPDLRVRVTAIDGGGSGSGPAECFACLQQLCVARDANGYVTGVFYADGEGGLIELPGCGSGGFAEDTACAACLERLCVTRDDVAVTGVFYADDDGTLFELPTCDASVVCCEGVLVPAVWAVSVTATGDLAEIDGVVFTMTYSAGAWSGSVQVTVGGVEYTLGATGVCFPEIWQWTTCLTSAASGDPCGNVQQCSADPATAVGPVTCSPWSLSTNALPIYANSAPPTQCFTGTLTFDVVAA